MSLDAFRLAFELSPILLTNGIADGVPGGILPLVTITQAANFGLGILNGSDPIDPNAFLGHWSALPGGTLIDYDIGDYPFANQTVAANATIAQPLVISMRMKSPVNQPGGYPAKLITFSALQAALTQHGQRGGTYTVLTPAFTYTNVILRQMRDASDGGSAQVQNAWQFDFIKPLLTLEQAGQATQVLNNRMQQIAGGLPNSAPTWSGLFP